MLKTSSEELKLYFQESPDAFCCLVFFPSPTVYVEILMNL